MVLVILGALFAGFHMDDVYAHMLESHGIPQRFIEAHGIGVQEVDLRSPAIWSISCAVKRNFWVFISGSFPAYDKKW